MMTIIVRQLLIPVWRIVPIPQTDLGCLGLFLDQTVGTLYIAYLNFHSLKKAQPHFNRLISPHLYVLKQL